MLVSSRISMHLASSPCVSPLRALPISQRDRRVNQNRCVAWRQKAAIGTNQSNQRGSAPPALPLSNPSARTAVLEATNRVDAMDRAAVLDRVRGALWGIFIADALSMPVHWYYDTNVLLRDFGTITTYQPPRVRHPGSIMSVSNTGGHGRGGQSGRIVGDVINHGKHEFWGRPGVHYHQGMKAGENTLNALCARVVMRGIARGSGYNPSQALSDYVSFMTTPGSHNDTYAESFHRDFFSNWAKNVPPEQCAKGTEGHNTAQIGGFVMLPPVIMASIPQGKDTARAAALQHLSLTHDSKKLAGYAAKYADLLYGLATGSIELRPALEATARTMGQRGLDLETLAAQRYDDVRVVHSVFGSACYIEDSFPSMLYLAYKYADDFEGAVLANTNVGGENCHRGAALGALMGAALGQSRIPKRFIEGLHDSMGIEREVEAFVAAVFPEDGKRGAQQQEQRQEL